VDLKKALMPTQKAFGRKNLHLSCASLGRNHKSHDIKTCPFMIIEGALKEIISSVKVCPSPITNYISLIMICNELGNRGE